MKITILSILLLFSISFTMEIDMNIIRDIESGNRWWAYNEKTEAIGLYQITPICLQDYNECNGTNYKWYHLYNETLNRDISEWYLHVRIQYMLKKFKLPITIKNVLWSYNCGIKYVCSGFMPSETKHYIKRYILLDEINKIERN